MSGAAQVTRCRRTGGRQGAEVDDGAFTTVVGLLGGIRPRRGRTLSPEMKRSQRVTSQTLDPPRPEPADPGVGPVPVGSFDGPRDDVDPGDAGRRQSELCQGLLHVLRLSVSRTRTNGAWQSRGDEPCPLPQLLGGATGVGNEVAGTGQTIGGYRGHGASQGLDSLSGTGADGDDRNVPQPLPIQDPPQVREHGVAPLGVEPIHLVQGDRHDLGVSRHGSEEVAMNDAVGVLLGIEDPYQDIDLSRHALGNGPVRELLGVDIGQVDQHRVLTQSPGSVDTHPLADVEPVQQRGGLHRGVRDDGEGLGRGRAGAGSTGHLGAGESVRQTGLARPGGPEESDHRGLQRQTSTVRGLLEDVSGLGELIVQTELSPQVDGPRQVLENRHEAAGLGVVCVARMVSAHRTRLPAGRRSRAGAVRSEVAAF